MPWFLRILLIVIPLLVVVYGYVSSRLGAAVRTLTTWPHSNVRRAIIAAIAFANLHVVLLLVAQIFRLREFTMALRGSSGWAPLLAYPFWGSLIFCAEMLPMLLVLDIARLPLWSIFQRHKPAWLRLQALLSVALAIAMMAYVSIRIVRDTFSVRLTRHEIAIANLPRDLEGFRIIQLSDLQADPYTGQSKMQRYVDLANAQQPDLVLFAGDVVTNGTDHIEAGAAILGRLRARLGVFACQGDHDYWAAPALVAHALRRRGVTICEDSVLALPAGESKVSLTIITNVYQRRPAPERLEELAQRRPAAAAHLLLSHQPNDAVVNFANANGYDLVVAGHTHGGQVVFWKYAFPLSASRFETNHVSGLFRIGQTLLSVTNGLGLTVAPVRYQAPAEVTLLTLHRSSRQQTVPTNHTDEHE